MGSEENPHSTLRRTHTLEVVLEMVQRKANESAVIAGRFSWHPSIIGVDTVEGAF